MKKSLKDNNGESGPKKISSDSACNFYELADRLDNRFVEKFNVTENFPFTLYYGIVKAIPSSWKTNVSYVENPNDNVTRLISFTTSSRPNKVLYNYFIKDYVQRPTAVIKWEQLSDSYCNWTDIFRLPFLAVRDAKVQYFQFRFIHRLVATNSFLYKIKLKDSPICTFCKVENETLAHLFWSCEIIRSFWHELFMRCTRHSFDLSLEFINFGLTNEVKHPVNFLLLHAKHFIFNCKLNDNLPRVSIFINKFKFLVEVECFILRKNNHDVRALQFQETFLRGPPPPP